MVSPSSRNVRLEPSFSVSGSVPFQEDSSIEPNWSLVGPDTVPYIANLMPGLFWTDAMFVNAQNIVSGEFTGEQAGENAAQVTQRWADQNPDLVENYTLWAEDLGL